MQPIPAFFNTKENNTFPENKTQFSIPYGIEDKLEKAQAMHDEISEDWSRWLIKISSSQFSTRVSVICITAL